MQQVFVKKEQIGREFVTIMGDDVKHIKNVLRMRPGEKIRVSTGEGDNYFCVLTEITDDFVQADILPEEATDTELPARIILLQGIPKGDRMETVVQKAVELGTTDIIPVAMKYCVAKIDPAKEAKKIARWQAIAESAAKQSKRSKIPTVGRVLSFREAVELAKEQDLFLLPYENERGMAATKEALEQVPKAKSIAILIGPEGGFSQEEIDAAKEDAAIISLGRRILRTDTAAITTVSLVMTALEMNQD